MSRLADIRFKTAQARYQANQKYLPTKIWEAFVWKNWSPYNKWDKKRIIEQGYERNAPFYAAANILAQTICGLPYYVEFEKRGMKDNTDSHPIMTAIGRNSSFQETIELMALYLIVTGDSINQTVFTSTDRDKRPLGLIPIPSQYVEPKQGDEWQPIQYYEVRNRKTVKLMPDEVIHILKPDLSNPFRGMSPGNPLSELIDLNNAGITWNKNIALSGGTPPIVAKAPQGMQPEEAREIQDSWKRQSGSDNSHVLKVIGGDLELENLNTDPHDAEWERAILTSMRMIFMAFGVSSSLMNDAANKTYNNVKDSRKALYLDGAIPIAERIIGKISKEWRPYYKDNPVLKIDKSSIEALQEDSKAQAERLSELKLSGIISANEARSVLKWPKSTEKNADLLETAKQPSQAPAPDDPVNQNPEEG
jgi:HK97 family phage portal protein